MTTLNYNAQTSIGKPITRGFHPGKAQSLNIPLLFSQADTIQVALPVQHGINNVTGLNNAQSVWIDNSDNASTVSLYFNNGFIVTCPAFAAGIFPILVDVQGLFFNAVSAGGTDIQTWFTNTREQPAIWSTKIPIAGTINVSDSVIFSSATPQAYTDFSGVLGAGGVSQELMAANGDRLFFAIRNPATPASQGIAAPEPVYLNWGGAAAINGNSSWELLPGETVTSQNLGIVSVQSVNWTAATAGHILIAKAA